MPEFDAVEATISISSKHTGFVHVSTELRFAEEAAADVTSVGVQSMNVFVPLAFALPDIVPELNVRSADVIALTIIVVEGVAVKGTSAVIKI